MKSNQPLPTTRPLAMILSFAAPVFLSFVIIKIAAGQDVAAKPQLTPQQRAMVELGRALYFDPRLSSDYETHFQRTGSIYLLAGNGQPVIGSDGQPIIAGTSCASCHDPKQGFSDGRPIALGRVGSNQSPAGRLGVRRSPTTLNVQLFEYLKTKRQFLDKRARDGLEQAVGPIANPDEMGDQSVQQMVNRLNNIQGYRELTRAAFNTDFLTPDLYAEACVAFQKAELVAVDTPLTRYYNGDKAAIVDESGLRGAALFQQNCTACHTPPLYTTGLAANNGVEFAYGGADDIGLQQTTGRRVDRFRFSIPGLVAVNMRKSFLTHESTFRNREPNDPQYDEDEALKLLLAHYASGGRFTNRRTGQLDRDPQIAESVARISLSAQDVSDLLVTLTRDLTPFDYPDVKQPTLPQ